MLFFLLAALLSITQVWPAEPSTKPKDHSPKYILFLTADGFRSDYLEWYHPTNLLQLIAEGVRVKHATNVFPTVTAPNMASLVTGSYPRTTGIACNSQYVRELDRIVNSPRDENSIGLKSGGRSGTTHIAAGTYREVRVVSSGTWTFGIE